MRKTIPYFIIRKEDVKNDPELQLQPNKGRKILINQIYIDDDKATIGETGFGWLEVATFTETASQDYHKHMIGTEIYTVLEGEMAVRLNETDQITLTDGDELIVFPDTPHEILNNGKHFLTRVHAINCYGEEDKYVRVNNKWCPLSTLNMNSK